VFSNITTTLRQSYWTEEGLRCRDTGADCQNCPIYKIYGRHKDKTDELKCHQPESNQRLLSVGIKPIPKIEPIPVKEIPEDKRRPLDYRMSEEEGAALRAEIVRALPSLEKPCTSGIVKYLNQSCYMGWADWNSNHIWSQMNRMKKAGVLKVAAYDASDSKVEHLEVADASKLKTMIRKSYRPQKMPQMIFQKG
jgi:hypothetical protein